MPTISVVIPCYNAGAYIERALYALEKQTYKDFDVILIDDCSTDNTQEKILSFKERSSIEIVYEKNVSNSGPAISRNRAISMSRADYICFCDSDDWYDECYLEKMVEASKIGRADMVFCGYKTVYEGEKNSSELLPPSCCNELSISEALLTDVDALWRLMVKKEIAQQYPLPDLRNGEDMAIIPIWILHSQCIVSIQDAIYNYLQRRGSLSVTANMRVVKSLISSFEYIRKYVNDEYVDEVEFIGIRNLVYGALLNLFKCGNDTRSARQIISDFEQDFPHWVDNKYRRNLGKIKNMYLFFISKRWFLPVRIMTFLHDYYIKYRKK